MLKNYFLVTLRNLWRNKLYAFISILGLGLGISCTTLIALYVFHEVSYDQFHENKDRLYRVTAVMHTTDVLPLGSTSMAVGPTMQQDFPEVEAFCRMMHGPKYNTLMYEDKSFDEEDVYFTDSAFFHIFSYRLLEGDPSTALSQPNSIVMSESTARKYFGDAPAVGKVVRTVHKTYTVTGVVEDCPDNSDFQYNLLISLNSYPAEMLQQMNEDWFYITVQTYVLLKENASAKELKARLSQLTENYVKPWSDASGGVGSIDYDLQRITDVHLDNTKKFDTPKGNKQYLYIFGMVGIFILIIACINYVNLSLSQSLRRAREVGIRKTLGADRGQLVRQFIGESFIIALISLLAGLALVEILLPLFNKMAQKAFHPASIFQPRLLLYYAGILLVTGVISGSYPAFVLSSFQPVSVLKGILPRFGNAQFLRKALVVVQFVFSVWMIMGTLVVFGQMKYMKERDLGFDREGLMIIQVPGDTAVLNKLDYVKQEMANLPEVKQVSQTGSMPGFTMGELLFRIEQPDGLQQRGIKFLPIDENFMDLVGLHLVQGRNIDPVHFPTDSLGGFIINETAAKTFGWQEPLGKRMQWGLMANDSATNDGKVIGVVRDFHFASMHNPIEPLVMFYHTWGGGMLTLKLQSPDMAATIRKVEETWRKADKLHQFHYTFLDDQMDSLYRKEERMLQIFGYFALISILIASLGLFALTSYSTERRTREIGIRKVMGASVWSICRLMAREFLILVSLAFVLAIPVGYYFLGRWLTEFAYRISIHPLMIIGTGLLVVFIAMLAISYHALKAAHTDPVRSIKYE